MGEFWSAVVAGVAVSLWNKFVVNGPWLRGLCSAPPPEEKEDECSSSTTSAISLDVHVH